MPCKFKSIFVEDWEDHPGGKCWTVKIGVTTAHLAKSQCHQGEEPNEFIAPAWLVNKIVDAADLIKTT